MVKGKQVKPIPYLRGIGGCLGGCDVHVCVHVCVCVIFVIFIHRTNIMWPSMCMSVVFANSPKPPQYTPYAHIHIYTHLTHMYTHMYTQMQHILQIVHTYYTHI
jgi:TRAP-type uncharacterized transport system fused permease subunit